MSPILPFLQIKSGQILVIPILISIDKKNSEPELKIWVLMTWITLPLASPIFSCHVSTFLTNPNTNGRHPGVGNSWELFKKIRRINKCLLKLHLEMVEVWAALEVFCEDCENCADFENCSNCGNCAMEEDYEVKIVHDHRHDPHNTIDGDLQVFRGA